MSLAVRDRREEQMDADDLDPATYAAILTDLAQVNRVVMSSRATLGFLDRALRRRSHVRLLDVGFGDGDMLRTIAVWARRHGVQAELVGIDLNPRSQAVAEAATPPGLSIRYMTGDYAGLAGGRFDLIVSSLVAHHMIDPQLIAFLRFMEAEARLGWLVNDLHRLRIAHAGFPILARAMRWHQIVREDGTLSVARSFRAEDWHAILAQARIEDAAVVRRFPFRLCVERLR